jgi:hypothetical protein
MLRAPGTSTGLCLFDSIAGTSAENLESVQWGFRRLLFAAMVAPALLNFGLLSNARAQVEGPNPGASGTHSQITYLATATTQDSSTLPNRAVMPADADTLSEQGWHFALSPYLWFPAVNGTVGALGVQAHVVTSAGDVLSHAGNSGTGPRVSRPDDARISCVACHDPQGIQRACGGL